MFSVYRSRRSGFVLVSVLMLGALLITCATAFAWFARMQLKHSTREYISISSRSMVQVLTQAIIDNIKANTMVKYDSLLLEWFMPFFFPAGDMGTWVVQIIPLDDKIPLRNLFLPDGTTLRNELRATWEDMWEKLEHRELGNIVLDFLDKDTKPRMGGAERESHINRAPLDMSELLVLEEMTPEILYGAEGKMGVADYCTLWNNGKINLNMAPRHVMEILPGMDRTLAEKVEEYRDKQALTGMDDLGKIPGFPPRTRSGLMNVAVFDSKFFLIKIEMMENDGGGTSYNVVFDKTSGAVVKWEEI